jgi:hypothetical protein
MNSKGGYNTPPLHYVHYHAGIFHGVHGYNGIVIIPSLLEAQRKNRRALHPHRNSSPLNKKKLF